MNKEIFRQKLESLREYGISWRMVKMGKKLDKAEQCAR